MCLVGIGGVFLVIFMLLLFSSYESTYFLDAKFEVGEKRGFSLKRVGMLLELVI